MVDSITLNPGVGGAEVATDTIDGKEYQRVKMTFGVDGAAGDVSNANPMPVILGLTDDELRASPVPVVVANLPAPDTGNPDPADPAMPVVQKPVQQWVCSFADSGSGLLTSDITQLNLGSGMAVSQSGGSLVLTTGTSPNADFLARSTFNFNGAFINRVRTTLSQRIANNNFAVLLADRIGEGLTYNCTSATVVDVTFAGHGFTANNIGQSICLGGLTVTSGTGVPGRYAIAAIPDADTIRFTVSGWATGTGALDLFGWNYYRALYTGTVATNVAVDSQRKGWANGDTTATINTTASPGHILQLTVDGRNAYWSDALSATSTAPSLTTRASRFENLPDAGVPLYLYLWAFNGTAAPATTTTWTVGFVAVEDTVNNAVYLAGVRQMGQAAPLPVSFPSAQPVTGTVTANIGTGTIGAANLNSPQAIADVASAALTTTTTTATITPTFGNEYQVNIPVTTVTGTNPTLDVVIQESDDSGTNWFDVWHMDRITGTGIYRSPKLVMKGNRVRYVQTVGGTTPSFTRAVNRLQGSSGISYTRRRLYDRALNVNSGTPNTAALNVAECNNLQLIVNMGAITTTAPVIKLQMSEDGVNWLDVPGGSVTAVASSTVQVTVANLSPQFVRAIVATTGSGATLGYVCIKGWS